MVPQKLPQVTPELMEYLETICPDAAPSITTTDREVWWNAGKVSLVRHLRSIFDEQQQTILQGD